MLLRCLGWRKRKREDSMSYPTNALLRTDSENVETTVCRRRTLFEGFVARMGEERLYREEGEVRGDGRG